METPRAPILQLNITQKCRQRLDGLPASARSAILTKIQQLLTGEIYAAKISQASRGDLFQLKTNTFRAFIKQRENEHLIVSLCNRKEASGFLKDYLELPDDHDFGPSCSVSELKGFASAKTSVESNGKPRTQEKRPPMTSQPPKDTGIEAPSLISLLDPILHALGDFRTGCELFEQEYQQNLDHLVGVEAKLREEMEAQQDKATIKLNDVARELGDSVSELQRQATESNTVQQRLQEQNELLAQARQKHANDLRQTNEAVQVLQNQVNDDARDLGEAQNTLGTLSALAGQNQTTIQKQEQKLAELQQSLQRAQEQLRQAEQRQSALNQKIDLVQENVMQLTAAVKAGRDSASTIQMRLEKVEQAQKEAGNRSWWRRFTGMFSRGANKS